MTHPKLRQKHIYGETDTVHAPAQPTRTLNKGTLRPSHGLPAITQLWDDLITLQVTASGVVGFWFLSHQELPTSHCFGCRTLGFKSLKGQILNLTDQWKPKWCYVWYLPNSRTNIMIKVVLDKPTNNARFPNSSILKIKESVTVSHEIIFRWLWMSILHLIYFQELIFDFLLVLWQAGPITHFRRKVRTWLILSNISIVSESPWPSSQDSLLSKPSILLGVFYIPVARTAVHPVQPFTCTSKPCGFQHTAHYTAEPEKQFHSGLLHSQPKQASKTDNYTNILAVWQHWLSGNNLFMAWQTSPLSGNFAQASVGFEKVGVQRSGSPEMCSSPYPCHVRGLQCITLKATHLTFYTATWQSDSICRNSLLFFSFNTPNQ